MGATGLWHRPEDSTPPDQTPVLVVVEGSDRRTIVLDHFPFTIGRRTDRDLVLVDPRVGREQAHLVRQDDGIHIVDEVSRHGTYVNGERIQDEKLLPNDRIEFAVRGGVYVLFDPKFDSEFRGPATSAVFERLRSERFGELSLPDPGGERPSNAQPITRYPVKKSGKVREYQIPGRLGPYEILQELGRGGSTVVCLARNVYSAVGRLVALKLPLFDQDERLVAHEAKLWKLLSEKAHPNILNLEDLNKVGDTVFFVMEYMAGGSLDSALRGAVGARRVELVSEALPAIVEGLAFAHSQSVIHGDIKPQNILVSEGLLNIKIGDFGLSRPAQQDPDASQVGEVMGTLPFMAPECFDGVRNYQTDIYAFGATLYYLMLGTYPAMPEESYRSLKDERASFRPDLGRISGLSPWLGRTIEVCMNASPEARFKDAVTLRDYIVPLVEPRRARRIVLTAWCNPQNESLEYDLEISGERSREILDVEVTYQTTAGLAREFDRIGDLAVERLHARTNGATCEEVEQAIKQKLKSVADDGSHLILGAKVRKALTSEKASALWLLYDPRLAGVPWELLDVDGLPMCRRFSFSRWPKLRSLASPPTYRLDGEIRILMVANPSGDLPGADRECARLIKEFESSPLGARLRIEMADHADDAFVIRSKMRHCHILHYAGHAVFADNLGDLTRSGWLLKGNHQDHSSADILRAAALSGFWGDSPPLLVFANACRSGQGSARAYSHRVTADATMGLAQAFLAAGVGNYIGTVWESPDDDSAADFASAFYTDFLSGRSVGDAVVTARNHCAALLGEEDLTWARYALFGDPLSHILANSKTQKVPKSMDEVEKEHI